jgi:hypothetical protein
MARGKRIDRARAAGAIAKRDSISPLFYPGFLLTAAIIVVETLGIR